MREQERGGGGGEAESPPPLLIRQFMALLFNKAIQGGEALWTRCSRGSIASEPLVWSVWGRLICSEDPLNCLSACVSSIDLHCVSSGPSPTFPPKTCEWTEQPVTSSCFHPFNFTGVPNRLQSSDQNKCVFTRRNAFSGEHS